MAQSAYVRRFAIAESDVVQPPRHSAVVRITHWITALSFFALLISGIAILLAHPRLYLGETGGVGASSLFDLPLPFVRHEPIRGPGRYLHFLAAWVCVLTGLCTWSLALSRCTFAGICCRQKQISPGAVSGACF